MDLEVIMAEEQADWEGVKVAAVEVGSGVARVVEKGVDWRTRATL